MNHNGRWQKLLFAMVATLLTAMITYGLSRSFDNSRHLDRLDERFINVFSRDERQTELLLEHVKRLSDLWEHQAAQDRTFADVYKRLDAVEAQQGELLKQIWRLQGEGR